MVPDEEEIEDLPEEESEEGEEEDDEGQFQELPEGEPDVVTTWYHLMSRESFAPGCRGPCPRLWLWGLQGAKHCITRSL